MTARKTPARKPNPVNARINKLKKTIFQYDVPASKVRAGEWHALEPETAKPKAGVQLIFGDGAGMIAAGSRSERTAYIAFTQKRDEELVEGTITPGKAGMPEPDVRVEFTSRHSLLSLKRQVELALVMIEPLE